MTDEETKLMAEKDAKIEELTKSLTDQKAELEKANGRVENAEKKFNEMGEETGDNRKAVAEAAKEVMRLQRERDEAKENFSKAKDDLAKANETKGPPKEDRKTQKTEEEQITEIVATLSEEDLKALDAARKGATDEQRKSIDAGGAGYLELLQGLKEVQSAEVDALPPWRKTPAQKPAPSGDEAKAKIRELFKRENKRRSNLPDGPSSTSRSDFVHQRPMRPKRSEEKVLG